MSEQHNDLEIEIVKEPFRVEPEHLRPHDTLLVTSEYVVGDPHRTAESRIATTLMINEILSNPYFDGNIIELYHSNRMIMELGEHMVIADNNDARLAELQHALMASLLMGPDSPVYKAQGLGRYSGVRFDTGAEDHRPHIRDHFIIVVTPEGERAMLIPSNLVFRDEAERLAPLAERLGIRMAVATIVFEGGNFLGDGDKTYTLRDTDADNVTYNGRKSLRGLDELFGKEGIDRVYLDGNHSGEQPVYHLDLAVSFLQAPDGSTVALLSSMRLAKKLLSESGLRGNIKVKDWFRQYVANEYQPKTLRSLSGQLLRDAMRDGSDFRRVLDMSSKIGEDPAVLEDYARTMLQQNVPLPAETMRAIGGSLRMFLGRENYDPVQSYLDTIGENLAREGIQVIEAPALILSGPRGYSFDRFSLGEEFSAKTGVSNIPIHCPVNGVTYNGGRKMFFTTGGIKPFDRYMRKQLRELGYLHAPLKHAVTLGWSQAGVHCGFVPFGQER
jgi:hypothetical protein